MADDQKFTPGPWKLERYDNWDAKGWHIECGDGKVPIWCYGDDYTGMAEEGLANARLIAKAPEMYEALKELKKARNLPLPDGYLEQVQTLLSEIDGAGHLSGDM